ncbi:MAG: hypothetical protein ABI572_11110 [Actinomycetota bacterium]
MAELSEDPDVRALYRVPPESFIAARDALVRARKDANDAAGATAVEALRKPTVPAWALDQLADRDPGGLEALVDAGSEVRAAQRAALSSTKHTGRLRDASAVRRRAVASLVETAREILIETGRTQQPHMDDITATLEAASVSDEVAALLRAGILERPMRDAGGFGDLFGLRSVPDLGDEAEEQPPGAVDPRPARVSVRPSAAPPERALADLQAEANRLRRDRAAADRVAQRARTTADRLAAEATAIRARLDVVEAKAREGERAARAAESEATGAAEAHRRARAALEALDG